MKQYTSNLQILVIYYQGLSVFAALKSSQQFLFSFAEQMMRNRDILEEKDTQISILQSNLRARESEMLRIREEESQRALVLQAAVLNYVNKVPSPR